MKKLILLFACLFLVLGTKEVGANEIDFSFQVKSEKELKVVNQNFSYPVELTPIVLKEKSGDYLYILSTSWSWICKSNRNILDSSVTNPVVTDANNCRLVSKPLYAKNLDSNGTVQFESPPLNESEAWMQSYNGIMGANIVENDSGEGYLVVFKHNENQNFRFAPDTPTYKNSFFDIEVSDCLSGMDGNGAYSPCWDSFTSFVSSGRIKLSGGNWDMSDSLVELGPIAWPYNLMIKEDGKRSGANFYHVNSFLDDKTGDLYVFSVDHAPITPGSVCMVGFKSESKNWPNSSNFKNLYEKRYENDSLPVGFDKTKLNEWVWKRGNKNDCFLGNTTERDYWSIYMDVARLAGTDYYVAVEEKIKDVFSSPKWTISLKVSRDLIHWTTMKILNQTNSGWGSGSYSYPRFFNSEGESAEVIDPNNFFILGTAADNNVGGAGYKLNAMNLSMSVSCLDGSDFDENGTVGLSDLIEWYGAYRGDDYVFKADFDCSGEIDVGDLVNWYGEYRGAI